MAVKLLNKYSDLRSDRLNLVTKEEWSAAVAPFSARARGQAANLAAHNWDVALVGERLLVCSAWSGGTWWPQIGDPVMLTQEQYDAFYPIVPYDTSTPASKAAWYNAAYAGKGKRMRDLQLEAVIEFDSMHS